MPADLQRFALDSLLAPDPADPARARPPDFLVQVPDLRTVRPHWHDYYELGYVLAGQGEHILNGRHQQIGPGSAFLLSPVDYHEIDVPTGRTLRCLNVVIAPSLVEQTLQSAMPDAEQGLPWTADLTALAGEVQRICEESQGREPGWAVLVRGGLQRLLVELARRCLPSTGRPAAPGRCDLPPDLARAVRFVERHFREPLTLAETAAVAHLSPHWFSERFRDATGICFQAYLKSRRLQFAHALLGATDLSVTDVCHAAGFNDLSWFSRAYRERYGTAPSRCRR